MRQEKANYSIKRMARLLKVSRSGYYKWAHVQQKRLSGKDDRAAFYDDVDRKIHQIWKDSDEVYGAPRITAELAERYRISLNRKTVAKRMRMMGIEGISPRAFVPVTTIQSKRKSTLPDLVKRMFDTGELNRVWMSDITYLRTGEGWLYLCAVRDGHSAECWAGQWIAFKTHTWLNGPCGWRIRCAVMFLMGWCFTLTVERNLPVRSSGKCAATWASLSLWGARACASITRWPSRSGRR